MDRQFETLDREQLENQTGGTYCTGLFNCAEVIAHDLAEAWINGANPNSRCFCW